MAYKNAKNILPESLLKEIQQYIDGEILYIPSKASARSGWGDRNGTRLQYRERNELIRSMYSQCCSCRELADRFYLSVDSIKKIVKS